MLISANFGSARAGLATVGYKLLNADKTEYAGRTTTGVTELGDGIYGVTVADTDLWGRSVVWDTGEASEVYACETFPDYAVAGDAMTLTVAYDAAKTAATQTSVNDIPTNAELTTALALLNDLSSADAQAAAAAALIAYGASTYAGGDTPGTTTLLSRIVGTLLAGNHTAQSGDAYARLGTPAGTSIAADIATRLATAGYTAPPSAVANAAAVWAAVERTLTAFGFTIEATVDEEALALAIVAAIGEEGLVDETAIALAITTALGSLSVTVASPVGSGGTITIHAGDDYLDAEGRAIAFTIADATHTYLLDDGTAAVLFKSAQATWTATDITSTAGGYIVKFEPDAADTAAVTYKQAYEVEATLTSGSVVTLCTGNLVVVRDIPAT